MKYTHATIEEMKEYLFDTMMAVSEHKDNWRLNAEDKNRLDNACSELNIVLEHLNSY
jgi:cob(I)alamin adenosyltransferase